MISVAKQGLVNVGVLADTTQYALTQYKLRSVILNLLPVGQMWPHTGCRVAPDLLLIHNENKLIDTDFLCT